MPLTSANGTRWLARAERAFRLAALLSGVAGLVACDGVLDVEFPGRIPAGQIDDPSLAPVLVASVIGDFECAYNNYAAGSSIHSDEYETSNANVPLENWGERSIGPDENDYVVGPCEANQSDFGMVTTMHTARLQAENVFTLLSGWTDAQVSGRAAKMATVRAYGGYTYVLMGETWCGVSFDGGPRQEPAEALKLAEARFTEAVALAQQGGAGDILNLARVGLARAKLDLKKYAEAAAVAALVPSGYEAFADRGAENDRRWNKFSYFATQLGAYVAGDAYRVMNDPRIDVVDANKKAFVPTVDLWIVTRYQDLDDPIRLASYREAQLIVAESKAQQGDVAGALAILNGRRTGLALTGLTALTQAQAVAAVLSERQRELSYAGGHRLADLLRYSLPWKGANGSPVKFNPYSSRPYGGTTCWPFPTKETNGA